MNPWKIINHIITNTVAKDTKENKKKTKNKHACLKTFFSKCETISSSALLSFPIQ